MLFGEPGSQKSGFALWYTQEMNLPTLYFSADMSNFQVSLRLASYKTGQTTEQVEDNMSLYGMDTYLHQLQQSKTVFCYDSHPSLDDMEEMLEAYVEVHDAWPQVVVVDNLMDVESEQGDEYGGLREICAWCHDLTRLTGAAVIVLHHASESDRAHDNRMPHKRKDIIQKVSSKPELILSVAMGQQIGGDMQEYLIACVKQRMGRQDPSAQEHIVMRCDPSHNSFYR